MIRKINNKKIKNNSAKVFIFLILFANIFPVFNYGVLAEGEETQPAEEVVEEVVTEVVPEDTTEMQAETPVENIEENVEEVSETESTEEIVVGNIEENVEEPVEVIEIEDNGTSTEMVGFTTTATTTLGTTSTFTSSEVVATTTEEVIQEDVQQTATTTSTSTDENIEGDFEGEGDLPTGTTTIDTGDAVATANLLNLVNTNSINSTGTIQMVNLTEEQNSDLDLRSETTTSSSNCDLTSCAGVENISAKIENDANIENVAVLQAGSGGNAITTSGGAVINTGDTSAGLNLVNVANTNIIDSNYFILTLNSFSDINGNIILPSLLEYLASSTVPLGGNINLNTNQNAEIVNDLGLLTNTGGNEIASSSNGLINTGDGQSITNIFNNINSNLFGGTSIAILLRVTGNWLGQALGLPEGTTFVQDGDVYTLEINSDGGVTIPGNLDFSGTSTAKIYNKADLLSDSGNNKTFDTENSVINTGDAVAAANVVNIANTNIVGKKWMLAIINIFGDFNGDLIFKAKEKPAEIVANTGGGGGVGGNYYDNYNNQPMVNPQPVENLSLNVNNFSVVRSVPNILINNSSSTVHQKVTLFNLSKQKVANLKFTDILYDDIGREMQRETWELGDVMEREVIELEYDVSLGGFAKVGDYFLSSEIAYGDGEKIYFLNNGNIVLNIDLASDNITLGPESSNEPTPQKFTMQPKESLLVTPATSTLVFNDQEFQASTEKKKDENNFYYTLLFLLTSALGSLYTLLPFKY